MKRCPKTVSAENTLSVKDIREAINTLKKNEVWDYHVHIKRRWPFISIERFYYFDPNIGKNISELINNQLDLPKKGGDKK